MPGHFTMIFRTYGKRSASTVLMTGTAMETMGGISTVVKGYVSAGLFEKVPLRYVATHRDGSRALKLTTALWAYARIAGYLIAGSIKVVHIHLSSRASFWRKLPITGLCRLFRKPFVLHLHGSEFMTFYECECSPYQQRIVRHTFDNAASIIVLSPQWADNVKTFTNNPNIRVIYNGVQVPESPPARSDRKAAARILFLGRLGWRKGVYDLIDALAELNQRDVDFRLVAAGDGEIAEVKAKCQSTGLAHMVDIPGWVSDSDKPQLLHEADIFVLPSHAEGLPMSLLEAMAAGLPLVCTSVGGMPTAVSDGIEGFVIPPGDTGALRDALFRLLTDRSLRNGMGDRAFARVKADFNVDHSVEHLIELYAQF